ncbi:hypothetical protein [Rosistilla oblonga]|uniref:Uncharacterized protein n=1 Tax=Rosistilla oblonga TaxID=2527990 RepID=A0A518ITJ0_9BACT|nr:hypothetical protein [Rosistilla oblonga]QDV56401.1 hypothetical protein Mal33_23910 [Rosistilla oblonga]
MTFNKEDAVARKQQQIKVGLNLEIGPPPKYQWSAWVLDVANSEIRNTFAKPAVEHLILQVQELAREPSPSSSDILRIEKVEDFFELKDKGGVLGNVNARLFFGIDKRERAIVIIGGMKKQNNGKTPAGDRVRMRRRWRNYLDGTYGKPGGGVR